MSRGHKRSPVVKNLQKRSNFEVGLNKINYIPKWRSWRQLSDGRCLAFIKCHSRLKIPKKVKFQTLIKYDKLYSYQNDVKIIHFGFESAETGVYGENCNLQEISYLLNTFWTIFDKQFLRKICYLLLLIRL